MLVFGVGLFGSDIILREVSAPISDRRGPEFAEKQPTLNELSKASRSDLAQFPGVRGHYCR
jgi:hypothetical protein